jgi:hypothetical protein
MSNGIASIPAPVSAVLSRATAVFLAAVFVSISGCDSGIARLPGTQANIAAPQNQPPGVRYQMDLARNRMWVLTHDRVFLYDISTPKTIVEVNLPAWQWVDTQYSCLPDLALGPKGEAVVTSNVVPTLWRIDPETLAVSVHELALDADRDRDVGFSGLAYSVEHGAFLAVSDVHGSLWRIDPLLRRGQKIQLSEPIRKACGIVVPSRSAQHQTRWLAALCVHTEEGDRTVTLAPDQRSAYVRAASCMGPLTSLAREKE